MSIINSLSVENFAAFRSRLEWREHGALNVIIGENDTGKTHLLKLLYAITRSIEEYWKKQAGPQQQDFNLLFANKLMWTFLPTNYDLKNLISYDAARLVVDLTWGSEGKLNYQSINYQTLSVAPGTVPPPPPPITERGLDELQGKRVVFLPAKEILSLYDAIIATRESQEIAAFDDTYYDLAQDFRQPMAQVALNSNIEKAMQQLGQVTGGGEIKMDQTGIRFIRGETYFNMHQTAEGIKKVGILARLMHNRRLAPGNSSLLFVDEPEANLHPQAIVLFAEILHHLAQSGIQIYLSTHSYFMLKRLEQLARENATDYTLLNLRKVNGNDVTGAVTRLADGLPENPIIAQSLRLFEEDLRLDLGN